MTSADNRRRLPTITIRFNHWYHYHSHARHVWKNKQLKFAIFLHGLSPMLPLTELRSKHQHQQHQQVCSV